MQLVVEAHEEGWLAKQLVNEDDKQNLKVRVHGTLHLCACKAKVCDVSCVVLCIPIDQCFHTNWLLSYTGGHSCGRIL